MLVTVSNFPKHYNRFIVADTTETALAFSLQDALTDRCEEGMLRDVLPTNAGALVVRSKVVAGCEPLMLDRRQS